MDYNHKVWGRNIKVSPLSGIQLLYKSRFYSRRFNPNITRKIITQPERVFKLYTDNRVFAKYLPYSQVRGTILTQLYYRQNSRNFCYKKIRIGKHTFFTRIKDGNIK